MSSNSNKNKKPQQQEQQAREDPEQQQLSPSTSSSASVSSLSPEKEIEDLRNLDLNTKKKLSASTTTTSYSDSNAQSARLGLKVATRPDQGGAKGRSTTVRANFYPIDIDFSKSAVQYDVDITCTFTRKDGSQGSFSVKREHRKWAFQPISILKLVQNF